MAQHVAEHQFKGARRFALAVYLVVAVGYSCAVIYSVFRSVFQHSPGRQAATAVVADANLCRTEFTALFSQLRAERQQLYALKSEALERTWMSKRLELLTHKRALESACDIGKSAAPELNEASARLESLIDATTIAATQFANQLAPLESQFLRAVGAPQEAR
jgi:hypothetical protein